MMKRPKNADIDALLVNAHSIHDYNKALELCEFHDLKATEIFNEIEKKRLRPIAATYKFLLRAYNNGRRLSKFDDLWERILSFDNDVILTIYVRFYNNYIKDRFYYNRILTIYDKFMIHPRVYVNLGIELILVFDREPNKEYKILSKIIMEKVSLNTYMYIRLLSICKNKRLIFEILCNSDFRPNERLYEKLLFTFVNDIKISIRILDMIERFKFPLSRNLVHLWLSAFNNEIVPIERLCGLIINGNIPYNTNFYDILIFRLNIHKKSDIIWQLYLHMRYRGVTMSMVLYNSVILSHIGVAHVLEVYEDMCNQKVSISESVYSNIISILTRDRKYIEDVWKLYSTMDKGLINLSIWKAICRYFVGHPDKMLIIYDTIKNDCKIFQSVCQYFITTFHNNKKIEDIYKKIINKEKLSIGTIYVLLRYFNNKDNRAHDKMRLLFACADKLPIRNDMYAEFPNYYDIALQTYDLTRIKYLCVKMRANKIAFDNNKLSAILEAYRYHNKLEEAIPLLDNKYSGKIIIFTDEDQSLMKSIICIRSVQNDMPERIKSIYDKDIICEYLLSLGLNTQIIANDVLITPDEIDLNDIPHV